jgi:hypothetical protein
MSGDVFATIPGYVREYGIYVMFFLAVVAAWHTWAGSWIGWTFALPRTQQLKSLRKQQARLKHLHDTGGISGWLLSGILWVLFFFGLQFMLEVAVSADQLTRSSSPVQALLHALLNLSRYTVGFITTLVSINRLTWYGRLERYDTAMASLNRAIARLEAKLAGQRPVAAT